MRTEQKRKAILTLCKVFPATHSKAGEVTGFESKLNAGEKIHTIRANSKGVWEKRIQDIQDGKKYLSIREWTGRPYNSEQRELAERENVGLQHVVMTYSSSDPIPQAWVEGKKISVEVLAKNDGLSLEDFIEWFFGNNKENIFEGVILHFTEFRY